MEHKLLFLDTETTGNEPTDRLCQVCYMLDGVLRVQNFKPPLPVSVKAMSITHITNKMLADEQPFVDSPFSRELQENLATGILVAHNAQFDIGMLVAEGLEVPKHICTLKVVRYLDEDAEIPEYNLQFLRYYFGLEIDAIPHSADGDVKTLAGVFEKLFEMAREKSKPGTSDDEIIERMIDISNKPSLIKRITFGKHAGKTVEEVAATDRSYLSWLLAQKRADPTTDSSDWIYTFEKWGIR